MATQPKDQPVDEQSLREDLLFALTGDSYGEELYVDTKAKFIVDDLLPLFVSRIQAECNRARLEGAIMGAKFGNAAFRQYNIADPRKPINLDTVRQMGIEQATEWAEKQC